MAFFTLQPPESRRAFFERITVAANVVQTHAATLYPFAWDPTASAVVVKNESIAAWTLLSFRTN